MRMLGLADTIKAIFPPFPFPEFVPNFTGYDLDQRNIEWYEFQKLVTPDDRPVHVRIDSFVSYS